MDWTDREAKAKTARNESVSGHISMSKRHAAMPRNRVLLFAFLVLIAGAIWLAVQVRHTRRMAVATSAKGRLNQLLLALHNYHDTFNSLPPAYIADENGTPLHSWRVLILPFLDEGRLYAEYRFDEPWDGPNNSKLANRMPAVFLQRGEPESNSMTNLVLVTGPGTAYPGAACTKFTDFRDGLENTILATEIGNSKIPWLSPRDLSVETMSFRVKDPGKPSVSCVAWRQPYVVFGDSISTFTLSQSISPESLRGLTTIAGGEVDTKAGLVRENQLSRSLILSGQ